jgi:HEPN domain-containing protein
MPPDKPQILLRKARQDELILEKLLADQDIDDDMLGFHAQQAAEKMLKAVLASRNVEYPKTHNLRILIELLASNGIPVPEAIFEVTRLTPFGTTFRYDHFPPSTQGERARWLDSIRRLRAFVETLLC